MSKLQIQVLDELVLVCKDLKKSINFYNKILGLKLARKVGDKMAWVKIGDGLIGLFKEGVLKFGAEHCKGPIHFAMSIDKKELLKAKKYIESRGIKVEGPVKHPHGDVSIYFDDPDKNRLELHQAGHHKRFGEI